MKTFVYRLPAETSPKKVKISRNRKAERYRYFSSNYRLATHISRPDAHTRQGILWKTIFEICNFILHISLPQKPYRPLLSSHQFSPENTQTAKKCIPLSLRFTPEMARSFSDHARNGSDDVTRFRKHFVRFAKRKKPLFWRIRRQQNWHLRKILPDLWSQIPLPTTARESIIAVRENVFQNVMAII